jgi:dTDP-4-dehydrorhamnose 3,5-epimerase
MKVEQAYINDLIVIKPKIFEDGRGYFFESWNQKQFEKIVPYEVKFCQDNESCSEKGVIRGLHYQLNNPQGKLVRVIKGTIYDVAVDIRKGSKTFGKYFGIELSQQNKTQLWIPPGFAHGFQSLENNTILNYKVTNFYDPLDDNCINCLDKKIGINWPLNTYFLSEKDRKGVNFKDAQYF